MDFGIQGKRALVTGSTKGIGAAIAHALAAEGVDVVVHGRNEADAKKVVAEITKAGGKATFVVGDLTDDTSTATVAKAAGDVDILVNNAGMFEGKGWFSDTAADWNHWYDVNVGSIVRLNNLLVPAMVGRGWGRVITLASVVASKPMGMAGYSATKAACINLAVSLAQSLAGTGVTSNAVSPALIMTEGVHAMLNTLGVPTDPAERAKAAADFAPNLTKRAGEPEEIADAVAFLCSERAKFITAQNLRVDGGLVATVN